MKLNVLYEDNHIIVVEKPCNILSQKDNTNDIDLLEIVRKYIKEKYKKPGNVYVGLVHRLDRPVGGIMVFAKTSKAASRLCKQLQTHTLKKQYLAVVTGLLAEDKGKLIDKLEKTKTGNTIVTKTGKEAILDYEVLERNKQEKITLVKIDLKTGRHHQIRVQFASRHHPLCGDQRYGVQDKTQIALYAYHLELIHPTTKKRLIFEQLPPKTGYWTKFTL